MRAPPCRKTASPMSDMHVTMIGGFPAPVASTPARARKSRETIAIGDQYPGRPHAQANTVAASCPRKRALPGFSLYGSTAVGSAPYASGASRALFALGDHLRGCDPRRRLAANSFRSDELAADLSFCSMRECVEPTWWPLKRRRVLRCDRQSARCSRAGRRSTDRCARGRPRERLTAPSRRSP